MNDGQAMLNEIQQALREREQQAVQGLIDLHGGTDGWFAECRARRRVDPDFRLALVIVRILHRGGTGETLRLLPGERRHFDADPAVSKYWMSVATSGTDGWREERARVREVGRVAAASPDSTDRLLMLDVWAVRSLMQTYRAWGQMLIDDAVHTGNNRD